MGSPVSMELYKFIRKKLGMKPYQMAKALRLSQTSWNNLEESPITTREIALAKCRKMAGESFESFYGRLEDEAIKADRQKRRQQTAEPGDL